MHKHARQCQNSLGTAEVSFGCIEGYEKPLSQRSAMRWCRRDDDPGHHTGGHGLCVAAAERQYLGRRDRKAAAGRGVGCLITIHTPLHIILLTPLHVICIFKRFSKMSVQVCHEAIVPQPGVTLLM